MNHGRSSRHSRFAYGLFAGALLGVFLAAALLAAPVQAQSQGDGSAYSRFGLGERGVFSSAQAQAMGGGGLALRSLNYTSFANPALWSDQELTRLAVSARYRRTDVENAGGQTSQLAAGALQAAHFSFPLYARKLGLGFGFKPFSRLAYRVQTEPGRVPGVLGDDEDAAGQYRVRYEGQGGLQQISGGLGYRLGDVLAVGARADVVFGILEGQRRTTFTNQRQFAPTTLSTRTRLAGVTGTAGALISLNGLLQDEDALSVGATLTLPARLYGERTRTLGEDLGRDTLNIGSGGQRADDGSLTIPLNAALGASYRPSARWTLVADARYEPWSSASNDFETTLPGYTDLRDRTRLSLGAEWLPAGENRNASFFSRAAYRLGGYYEQTYVDAQTVFGANATSDAGVNELAATGGLSLPTPLYGTRVDLGFEVGTRGTTDDNLLRDLFYGVTLGINLGERWFQRRRLR